MVPGRGQGLAAIGCDHQLPGEGRDQGHQHRLADKESGLHAAEAGLLRDAGPARGGRVEQSLHQRLEQVVPERGQGLAANGCDDQLQSPGCQRQGDRLADEEGGLLTVGPRVQGAHRIARRGLD